MAISNLGLKKCDVIFRSINCGRFTMLFHTGSVLEDSINVGTNGIKGPAVFEYNSTSGNISAVEVEGEYNVYTYDTFIQGQTDYYVLRIPGLDTEELENIFRDKNKNKNKTPYQALTSNCQNTLFKLYGKTIPTQADFHPIIMNQMISHIHCLPLAVKLFLNKSNSGATTDVGLLENVVKASVKLCNVGGVSNPTIMAKAQLIYDIYNILYLMRLVEELPGSKVYHVTVGTSGNINMVQETGTSLINEYNQLVHNLCG